MEENLKKIQVKKSIIKYILKKDNRVEITGLVGYLYGFMSDRYAKEHIKYMTAIGLLAMDEGQDVYVTVTKEGKKYADNT